MEHALDHILDKFLGTGVQGPLTLLECVSAAQGWGWFPWKGVPRWELERESKIMALTGTPAQI